jgi:hypothetical protein
MGAATEAFPRRVCGAFQMRFSVLSMPLWLTFSATLWHSLGLSGRA